MRRCVFVVGPERSGTRAVTEFFIKLGFAGQFTHDQEMLQFEGGKHKVVWEWAEERKKDKIVIRFSYPHQQIMPPLRKFIKQAREKYDDVRVVIIHRHPVATQKSKFKSWGNGATREQRQQALYHIFTECFHGKIDPVIVNYEMLSKWSGFEVADETMRMLMEIDMWDESGDLINEEHVVEHFKNMNYQYEEKSDE